MNVNYVRFGYPVYHRLASRVLCATLGLACWTGLSLQAKAASLFTENFAASDASWVDRDAAEMTVGFASPAFGNPAGSLKGTFAAQGAPAVESDAFRADGTSSGGNFTGNYFTGAPTFNSWVFDFYADDVLPSDLIVRFGDGVNTFSKLVTSQVNALDTWKQVTVSLSFAGWVGGDNTAFNNALAAVSFVDVQVTRNGTGAQGFFLDNFQLAGGGGGGGGGSAVPEPEQGLIILGAMVLFALRRVRMFLPRTRS